MQETIFPILKNGKFYPLGNYKQVVILKNVPKISECVAHDRFSNFILV
jgi:hypothetical protein